jgi:sugar lactone lactonase YvrE
MTKPVSTTLVLAALLMTALAGCSGAGSTVSPSGGGESTRTAPMSTQPAGARGLVYVSDQLQKSVLAFPAGKHANNPAPALTISLGVITQGVWVDRHGILYVGLSGQFGTQSGSVEEFKPGQTVPFRTITDGISQPQSLLVDGKGTLYVDQIFDTSVEILEYSAGRTSPSKILSISDKGEPAAGEMTLDTSGNLYVHTFFIDDPPSRVFRFAPGQTVARDLRLQGLGNLTGLSGDARGNLYVADSAAGISVYAPGQTKPTRKIAPPPNVYLAGFVATRAGELYVANENPSPSASSLLEYAVGGAEPVNALSGHLQAPVSAALEAAAF